MSNEQPKILPYFIPYQDQWNDSVGYMSGAVKWAEQHPDATFCWQGYRFNKANVIECYRIEKKMVVDKTIVTVTLRSWSGGHVIMTSGTIEVFEHSRDRKPKKIYRQFFSPSGEIEWRLSQEIKTKQYDNFDDIPVSIAHLTRSVSSIFYRICDKFDIPVKCSLQEVLGHYEFDQTRSIMTFQDPNAIKEVYQEFVQLLRNTPLADTAELKPLRESTSIALFNNLKTLVFLIHEEWKAKRLWNILVKKQTDGSETDCSFLNKIE